MKMIIAQDRDLERHSPLIKLTRFFVVPLLNIIPASFLQMIVRKFSPFGKKVIEKPGTTHSLEVMYSKPEALLRKNIFNKAADFFWNNIISQPKAIRNRLKVVEENLEEEIKRLLKKKNQIDLLTIGGGSSRAIIQTISQLLKNSKFNIKITNLDKDKKAIELGQEKAKQFRLEDIFTWVNGDVRSLKSFVKPLSFDIVEMVGLLDYFNSEESKMIVQDIYGVIKPGGLFIMANVYPNSEVSFVHNVGWPKMYYKTEGDLADILKVAGFKDETITLIFEPLKVHLVGLAKK